MLAQVATRDHVTKYTHYDVFIATGLPRPMENPLVPSGMRGTEACLTGAEWSESIEDCPARLKRLMLDSALPTLYARLILAGGVPK